MHYNQNKDTAYEWRQTHGVWSEKYLKTVSGLVFCFTGRFSVTRGNMEKLAINSGASVTKSVNKKTTHLVAYDPSKMSSKTKNAVNYGIEIITEKRFFEMCNGKTNIPKQPTVKKQSPVTKKKKHSGKRRIQL